MYYETFRTAIENILEDDEARQGVRARINVRPAKYTSFGLGYSKRFQSSNQNKSDNINGFLSYTKLPGVGGRVTLNYNRNESNYLQSNIISIRHSRDLIERKLSADFYYRLVNYTYTYAGANEGTVAETQQYYIGANLMYRLSSSLTFSVLGEFAARESEENSRVNARIIKRFDSKKKKLEKG
jgi:hemolysin activation/secretion protein